MKRREPTPLWSNGTQMIRVRMSLLFRLSPLPLYSKLTRATSWIRAASLPYFAVFQRSRGRGRPRADRRFSIIEDRQVIDSKTLFITIRRVSLHLETPAIFHDEDQKLRLR